MTVNIDTQTFTDAEERFIEEEEGGAGSPPSLTGEVQESEGAGAAGNSPPPGISSLDLDVTITNTAGPHQAPVAPAVTSAQAVTGGGWALPSTWVQRQPIVFNERQFRDVVEDAQDALYRMNATPVVFRSDKHLIYVGSGSSGPTLLVHTADTLVLRLSEVADWMLKKKVGKGTHLVDDFPPQRVVNTILAKSHARLPELEVIRTTPFLGVGQRLVDAAGYSVADKAYIALDPTLTIPTVSPNPSGLEVSQAAKTLLEDLLGDFPYAHDADRAHMVGLIVLPFLQCIAGPTPLHILEAPEVGSGKSLQGDVVSSINTGQPMFWRALPEDEIEKTKTVFTALLSGEAFVAFDNVKGMVESPALEGALTSRVVKARLLGTNTEAAARNRAVWVLSANNVTLSRDMGRRSVRIRIDAKSERPEEGRTFTHQDLLGWVCANRGLLVHAVLTLIQNWVAKGCRPFSGKPRASFESWSRTVGGILEAAGIPGFLAAEASMTATDPALIERYEFIDAWRAKFSDEVVTAKQLLTEICAPPVTRYGETSAPKEVEYLPSVLANGTVGSRAVRLGKWLKANVDRVIGDWMLVAGPDDKHAKKAQYQLVAKPVPTNTTERGAEGAGSSTASGNTVATDGTVAAPAGSTDVAQPPAAGVPSVSKAAEASDGDFGQ